MPRDLSFFCVCVSPWTILLFYFSFESAVGERREGVARRQVRLVISGLWEGEREKKWEGIGDRVTFLLYFGKVF